MTIYTDAVHLIGQLGPANAFAAKVGLRRSWLHGDHCDLTTRKPVVRAVEVGAVLIDMRDLKRVSVRTRR